MYACQRLPSPAIARIALGKPGCARPHGGGGGGGGGNMLRGP
jgi:hypothetical protein